MELLEEGSSRAVLAAPPSLDPDAIAAEMQLDGCDWDGLARARRDFARQNHPDQVAPGMRDHAVKRMQIANALIDQAREKIAPHKG